MIIWVMRILHVITSLYTGGAEHLLVDILPILRDDGRNEVELLVINGVETAFKKAIQDSGITVHSLSMTNDVYNPRNVGRFSKFFSQHTYDIIHTHNTAPQLYVPLSLMLSGIKATLVTTEHSSSNRRRSRWWFKPIDKWMYNRYAAIVCISDQARRHLEDYIGSRNNVSVIINGIDLQRFRRPVKNIVAGGEHVIVMVAGFRPEKDHDTLFRAMTRLPENYRLQLVGWGENVHVERLKSLADQLGLTDRVEFMGVRTDVPDILEQADVAVLSSHWEGFGLAAVEAMATATPTIASDVDGLNGVVGGAGVLFPQGDDMKLAEDIRKLCENIDEYNKVAACCQAKAAQYDISVTADSYLELYRKLLPHA